jgi:hypothetical protein
MPTQSGAQTASGATGVRSTDLIGTVQRLVHEGNVRRIKVKQDGQTVAEFPLTVGVVGAAFAPVLAALGALAALLAECTIEVERTVAAGPSTTGAIGGSTPAA